MVFCHVHTSVYLYLFCGVFRGGSSGAFHSLLENLCALLVAFLTVWCVVLTIINVITIIIRAIINIALCQNPPNAWWARTNHQLGNKYEREIGCNTPCSGNFAPSAITGFRCVANNIIQPAYCPQAEIYRIANGYNYDINYLYANYNTAGNVKYASCISICPNKIINKRRSKTII